jgi:hydrogenase expression/formation protein HypE
MVDKIKFPQVGKITPEFFDAYVYPRLGAQRKEIIVGPQNGVDTGIVRIGAGKVMVVTTDPIYIGAQHGWRKGAWFAWHILASDITTSGFPPAYIIPDWNMPMETTEEAFDEITKVWHEESLKYGAAIIAGHTARYTGMHAPWFGGATFIAIGDEDKYVTPNMAQVGDLIYITKGAAIETIGIFADTFPNYITKHLGEDILAEAKTIFYQMSTVEEALIAASIGVRENGVTAMHDATECGIIGGLYEIAQASKVGLEVNLNDIPVHNCTERICGLFKMDPLISISEGTLIITIKEFKAKVLEESLFKANIKLAKIGRILPVKDGIWQIKDGQRINLIHPRVDPYWFTIFNAIEEGLN